MATRHYNDSRPSSSVFLADCTPRIAESAAAKKQKRKALMGQNVRLPIELLQQKVTYCFRRLFRYSVTFALLWLFNRLAIRFLRGCPLRPRAVFIWHAIRVPAGKATLNTRELSGPGDKNCRHTCCSSTIFYDILRFPLVAMNWE